MELWDLYTENRVKTGETHVRGNPLPENKYHLVVNVWIKSSDGKYLISRRSRQKSRNPLKFETVGGAVLKGENSLKAAIRETKEEVGIDLSNISGKKIFHKNRPHFRDMMDVWLFHYDGEVDLNKATTKEVCETMWLSYDEIKDLLVSGELVPTLDYFFDINKDELGDIK